MKNTQKGFVNILIIIVVLVIISGGIYTYSTKKSQVNTPAGSNKVFNQVDGFSNDLPMYGAENYEEYISKRNEQHKNADDALLLEMTKDKNTEAVAKDAIRLGWNYMSKGDVDVAMKRFNQAWLFDHDNFNVYWGYAAIFGAKNELEKSAEYFDKAFASYSENKAIAKNDYLPLRRDASLTYINLSDKYLSTDAEKAKTYSSKAIKILSDSLKEKDKIPKEFVSEMTLSLAIAYFNNGLYKEARGTYNSAVKDYPEAMKTNPNSKAFDQALKEKGY